MTFRAGVLCLSAASLFLSGRLLGQAGSRSWVGLGPPGFRVIDALALDPASPSTIYIGTREGGVLKTTNCGATWLPMNTGLADLRIRDLVVHPSLNRMLYAATAAGVFKSADGGESWTFSSAGIPEGVGDLEIDRSNASTLYAVTGKAIYRSADAGATWNPRSGLPEGLRTVAVDPTLSSILYTANSSGIYKSVDGGVSWSLLRRTDHTTTQEAVLGFLIDPHAPATIYASTLYTGPLPLFLPFGSILRSQDGGASWIRLRNGLPQFGLYALATDPLGDAVYAATSGHPGVAGGAYRSSDAGSSWVPHALGLPSDSVTALAVHPLETSALYTATFTSGVFTTSAEPLTGICAPDATTLCLQNGLFSVQVSGPGIPGGGSGRAVPLTSNTGAFWFFNDTNLEIMVKILDGRPVNGRFWLFYGSSTNVEFTLTVTSTQTRDTKTYFNPQGRLASGADIRAF